MSAVDYVVLDLEMTGLNVKTDKIIEIGAARVRNGKVVDTYATFLNVKKKIPEKITELTGITQDMLSDGLGEDEAMERLFDFLGEDLLLGHNFSFDYGFLAQWAVNHKRRISYRCLDTLAIARAVLPKDQSKRLGDLCLLFDVKRENAHRALDDAIETHEIYQRLLPLAEALRETDPGKAEKLLTPRTVEVRVKKVSPATKAQLEQIQKYRKAHGVTEPVELEAITRGEASRLMDHYYNTYGRP